jgi:hypothetical protein
MTQQSRPREFWILDQTEKPYPTCYRREPTWGGEPSKDNNVIHVREVTPHDIDLQAENERLNEGLMIAMGVISKVQTIEYASGGGSELYHFLQASFNHIEKYNKFNAG